MVNLLTIDGQKFLVDVGFGPDGPCRPLLLHSGQEFPGIFPQTLKLEHRALPRHTDQDQRVWVYSYKRLPEDPWLDAYAFNEIEFFPEDYEVMNLHTMTTRWSFFTQTVLCVKVVLDEKQEDIEGVVSLYKDEVKKKIKGEVVESEKFETETERVKGLEKWFGIRLNEEERKGIRYLSTELGE
jgi:arylamine N-acetyltransferase